ncbi:MAG: hypothetical protein ACRD0W_25915, partial [Acidimicrobiales bacterium]
PRQHDRAHNPAVRLMSQIVQPQTLLEPSRRRRFLATLGSDTIASLPLGQAHRTPAGFYRFQMSHEL